MAVCPEGLMAEVDVVVGVAAVMLVEESTGVIVADVAGAVARVVVGARGHQCDPFLPRVCEVSSEHQYQCQVR